MRLALVIAWAVASSVLATVLVMFVTLPTWNPDLATLPAPAAADVTSAAQEAEVPRGRVLVVIVDGLSSTHARTLPALAELRSRGVFRPLVSHYPTFTSPNVVAMMTGRAPRESGVRLNGAGLADRGLDSVLMAARDQGRPVAVYSRQFAPFEFIVASEEDPDLVQAGRLRFAFDELVWPVREPGRFELVHIGEVDDAGHADGPEAPSYAAAALHADAVVARLAASLDTARDVLVVLSDHGHIPKGGHGGDEEAAKRAFFLAAFGPVRAGVELEPRAMRDVGPTLALLAGTRPLAHAQGAAMIDLFERPSPQVVVAARASLDRAARSLCADAALAGCEDLAAQEREDLAAVEAAVIALGAAHDAARLAEEESALARRGALAGLLGVGLGAAFVARGRGAPGRRARARRLVWATLVLASVAGTYAAYLGALGYHVSLSGMAGTEYFLPDAAQAGSLAALAGVATTLVASRRAATPTHLALLAPAHLGAVLGVGLLWFYVGFEPARLGPNRASTMLFLSGPLVVAAALVMVVGALLDRRAARRRARAG